MGVLILEEQDTSKMDNLPSLEELAKNVKEDLPKISPEIVYGYKVEDRTDILNGKTRITVENGEPVITVHIQISKNLFEKKGIGNAIRMVLAHELCHIVNPFRPNTIMEKYLPKLWKVWKVLEEKKALECSAEVKEMKKWE